MTSSADLSTSTLRVALAQLNTSVGDIVGNCDKIVEWTGRAAALGADLVAFPEMAVVGYQVDDLALRSTFVRTSRAALDALPGRLQDAGHGDVVAVLGFPRVRDHCPPKTPRPPGSPPDAPPVLHPRSGLLLSPPPPPPPYPF